MATSGPGWETIDAAWWQMQADRENERLRREREANADAAADADEEPVAPQDP